MYLPTSRLGEGWDLKKKNRSGRVDGLGNREKRGKRIWNEVANIKRSRIAERKPACEEKLDDRNRGGEHGRLAAHRGGEQDDYDGLGTMWYLNVSSKD